MDKLGYINAGQFEEMTIIDAMREVVDVFIKFNIKTDSDIKALLRVCHLYNQLYQKGIVNSL